jgi:hypothetical protein
MGNFPIAIYMRLMDGLANEITNVKKRKKHILENMLYMCEINKKNAFICKRIFDANDDFQMNIYRGNNLEADYNEVFNVDKFDIIVGNPPYNAPGARASGNTIWQFFVRKSIESLKDNGYLCFIHPNGWRKPNTENGKLFGLFDLMVKQNCMIYLEIHDSKDGMKQFNCGTRYDWYVIKKKKNKYQVTTILDQNNVRYKIDLNRYNWLANSNLELIDQLLAGEDDEKCEVIYSRSAYETRREWISEKKSSKYKYPIVHTTPKKWTSVCLVIQKRHGTFWSKKSYFWR